MKILHIVGSFLNGGIETLLVNVANQQAQNGNKVGIMFITNQVSQKLISQIDSSVCKFYIKKPVGSKNPYYMLKMNYYYRRFNPEVLHLHAPNIASLLFSKRKRERRFVTLHNNVMKIHYNRSVDMYIAISECVLESFVRQTGKANCVVCYNGIALDKFQCKKEYCIEPRNIVCVGRVLFGTKGQDLIIEALKLLKKNGYSMTCSFYGGGKDYDKLKTLIEDNGLQGVAVAFGDVSNEYIAEHLHEYDIAVQASYHEGLGISAIETMACGVPTILSAVDGFLEVSDHGKYAILFAKGSVVDLYEKLSWSIDNYKDMVELAENAKTYIEKNFSLSRMVAHLDLIYKS